MEFFAPAMNFGQAFWLACMGPAHAFRGQGYRVREPFYERPPMQLKQNAGNGRARVNAIDIAAIDIKASPCNEASA
jgi:hypothetical protein